MRYATEEELQAAGITEDCIVRELRADNGWNASWMGLPMAGISEIPEYAGELFTIEYRAVEIAIGDQPITPPTAAGTARTKNISPLKSPRPE